LAGVPVATRGIIIEPSRRDMETPDINPFAGLQGSLVAESAFVEPGRLLESEAVNPPLLAGEWTSRIVTRVSLSRNLCIGSR
jgi:hypothetical protein